MKSTARSLDGSELCELRAKALSMAINVVKPNYTVLVKPDRRKALDTPDIRNNDETIRFYPDYSVFLVSDLFVDYMRNGLHYAPSQTEEEEGASEEEDLK